MYPSNFYPSGPNSPGPSFRDTSFLGPSDFLGCLYCFALDFAVCCFFCCLCSCCCCLCLLLLLGPHSPGRHSASPPPPPPLPHHPSGPLTSWPKLCWVCSPHLGFFVLVVCWVNEKHTFALPFFDLPKYLLVAFVPFCGLLLFMVLLLLLLLLRVLPGRRPLKSQSLPAF